MYDLQITPAQQPLDYNAAVHELYMHARHRHLTVRSEGTLEGQHHYALLDFHTSKPVAFATIRELSL